MNMTKKMNAVLNNSSVRGDASAGSAQGTQDVSNHERILSSYHGVTVVTLRYLRANVILQRLLNIKTLQSFVTMLALSLLLTGCTGLQAPKVENTHLYALDARPTASTRPPIEQVLSIGMPTAWPGYDTPQIAYQRQPLELEYFVTHRWADDPARLLRPLLTQALEPAFRAVVPSPGTVTADIRLDTELIRLQQNFASQPSRTEVILRVQLTDLRNKKIIASKMFEASEPSSSEDAYGGVIAANLALQRVLEQVTEFCAQAAASR